MSDFALQLARRFQARHVLIVLAAVVASFAVLDLVYRHVLDSLVAFRLEDSDPAARNSLSAVVIGLFLFSACALAVAASRMRPRAGAMWWTLGAAVLAFFAVDEILGAHTWATQHADVSWNVAYLPFLVVAAIVWFETGRAMGDNRRAQAVFCLGVAGWLAAGLLDAARTGRTSALPGAELLEMASAAAMLLGMFTYARSLSQAQSPLADLREANIAIVRSAVSRLDPRTLLIGLVCCLVVLGVLGAIVYPGGGDLRVFDLNKEQTFPATFSGLLLFGAGAMALMHGVVRFANPADRRWWLVLAAVFMFLGLDEIAALHEAVQDRVHLWGQATLAPIVLAGVVAWFVALKQLNASTPGAARLFVLGAAAWIASQGIDLVLNERLGASIVPEELLEMAGSALFGIALLVAVRELAAVRSRSKREPRPAVTSLDVLQAAR